MTTPPLVTVLMAVHNGGIYVEKAVASILRQTFTDFEFLIIDDDSTDDTRQRLAAFHDRRIRVVRNEVNVGLTRSLNRGLAMARGTLIARQDADDISHKNRLGTQVSFLDREPNVIVLGTQGCYIDELGRPKSVAPWPKSTSNLAIRWQLLFDGPFIHSSVMFRRGIVWNELGGYDDSFATSQDFELWSRVSSRGYDMRNLSATLVDFRIHRGSASTRYALDGIAKVAAIVRQNLIAELGTNALPDQWPDAWIRLTNPSVFPRAGDEWETVTRAIECIHRAFTIKYPESVDDGEIRRHLASMLIRLSNSGAARGRMKSITSFAQACRLNLSMATLAAPRFLGHLTIGRWRRAAERATTQTSGD